MFRRVSILAVIITGTANSKRIAKTHDRDAVGGASYLHIEYTLPTPPATDAPTPTFTPTDTPTPTPTSTDTPTPTLIFTPTFTPTASATLSASFTPTPYPGRTADD